MRPAYPLHLTVPSRINAKGSSARADIIDRHQVDRIQLGTVDAEGVRLPSIVMLVGPSALIAWMVVREATSIELHHTLTETASLALDPDEVVALINHQVVTNVLTEWCQYLFPTLHKTRENHRLCLVADVFWVPLVLAHNHVNRLSVGCDTNGCVTR